MMFRVKVMCIGQQKRKLVRKDVVALIESENLDTVMEDGTKFAETVVPSDAFWREFTTLVAERYYLPVLLSITSNGYAEMKNG